MKHIKTFESHSKKVYHLSEIKSGDIITYQGSKYEVIEVDEVVIKAKSIQTNREILINQGQIEQYGINIISDN
jgi:hypothetical protein